MAADDKLRGQTSIIDLRPGMKNVTCAFIVIDKGTASQTKDGSIVRKCRVADGTGSVSFSLWKEQADAVEEGDILRLIKGYASLWKGGMVLYCGKYGILEKTGEFTMVYSESPDMSDLNQDFAQQANQQQHTRGQSQSGNRWTDPRTGPGGNRNGNNHLRPGTEIPPNGAPPSERNRGPLLDDPRSYPPPQHKPLMMNEPEPFRTHGPPATHFQDQPPYINQPPHVYSGTDLMYDGYDYERHANSFREGHREGHPLRHRTDLHKDRFHPYQRPPPHNPGFVPQNFRDHR